MFRLPIAILILSALTFGLFITASPTPDAQAAPRSIPWDCSDWQETPAVADAEDARVSMILESLAANRGKSIYCAIDQSDTWTKSETWLAGRDRNERDDTVYFGQQGNFRGFLAAQEGYLTDGESGVTGVSRDLIFEFPREERRGKKTVRFRVRSGSADTDTCPDDAANPGNLLCTPFGGTHGSWLQAWSVGDSQKRSRGIYGAESDEGNTDWRVHWRTGVRTHNVDPPRQAGGGFRTEAQWIAMAEARAIAACRARGGKYVPGSADFGPGHNRDRGSGVSDAGANLGWFYLIEDHPNPQQTVKKRRARESRTWVGVCTKRVRRR